MPFLSLVLLYQITKFPNCIKCEKLIQPFSHNTIIAILLTLFLSCNVVEGHFSRPRLPTHPFEHWLNPLGC